MEYDTAAHVPPIRLWQVLCGGIQLPKHDYQHVISCAECESLATQISDALDGIEEALQHHNIGNPRVASNLN